MEEPAPLEEAPAEEPAPEIVPLDGNGEALSLATQEAADALAEPDPWFACTGDIDGICSYAGANSLNTALSNYAAMGGSGPIYLEGGTHTVSANVTINGATLANLTGIMADTGESSATVNLNLGANFLTASDLTNGFILKGMNIYGTRPGGALVEFTNNAGTLTLTDLIITNSNAAGTGDGLLISDHTGNVTLHTIKADNNTDGGADFGSISGNVSVTNSSFDSNGAGAGTAAYSLVISAQGSVTLNGVSASNFSGSYGALVESQKSVTIKNSNFNANGDSGLWIPTSSSGTILLDHVYANNNFIGTGIIASNHGGAVTMNTIEATGNRFGVDIDNCFFSGGGCLASSSPVTLTNLTLEYNTYGGLHVLSKGNISVANIRSIYANNASAIFAGIQLDNSNATSACTVAVSNAESRNNYLAGVVINTRGAVTLNKVTASDNYYGTADGINITSTGTGAVSILGTLGQNYASGNNGYGIHIVTNGAVTINKMEANYNILTNLFSDNTGGTGAVTLNTGSYHVSSTGSGITINTRGAINLTNVSATSNAVDGIFLANQTAPSSQPVTIKTTSSGYQYVH